MDILPPPPPGTTEGSTPALPPPAPESEGPGVFNFGGPGWFTDIFDVKVVFDNDVLVRDKGAKFTVPFNSFREAIPMYGPSDVVSGIVTVKSPEGFEVTANMITIKAEEYVCLLDPYVTNDTAKVEEIVSPTPVLVVGEQKFRFELDLSCSIPVDPGGVAPRMPVKFCSMIEDYSGKQFGIKHAVVIDIARPWWTFDVQFYEPFAVYDCSKPAPFQSAGKKELTENELEQLITTEIQASYLIEEDDREEEEIRETVTSLHEGQTRTEPHVLKVSDFPAEVAVFDYRCDSINMDQGIIGTLTIRNSRVDVQYMEFSFYKQESIDGSVWESVLSVIQIGKDGPLASKSAENRDVSTESFIPAFEGLPVKIGFEGIVTQTSRPKDNLELEDESDFLSPTLTKRMSGTGKNIYKHTMSIEYFVRLSIVSSGDEIKYWDTNEVYIHRKKMPEGHSGEYEEGDRGGGGGV